MRVRAKFATVFQIAFFTRVANGKREGVKMAKRHDEKRNEDIHHDHHHAPGLRRIVRTSFLRRNPPVERQSGHNGGVEPREDQRGGHLSARQPRPMPHRHLDGREPLEADYSQAQHGRVHREECTSWRVHRGVHRVHRVHRGAFPPRSVNYVLFGNVRRHCEGRAQQVSDSQTEDRIE